MHCKKQRHLALTLTALVALTGCMAPPAKQTAPVLASDSVPAMETMVEMMSIRDTDPIYNRRDNEPDWPFRTGDEVEIVPEVITGDATPDNRERVKEKQAQNQDSIGWVSLPSAGIDEVILYHNRNNEYYLHRDFYGYYDRAGSFFADYRSNFGRGTRDDLAPITALYGHSYRDDPSSGLFSGLKYYRDESFARANPYIYFSTWKENMAFEVVAVFESHVHIPYNRHDLPGSQYKAMLETVSASSLYDYGVSVNKNDKLLVLSTCAMNVQGHANLDPYTTDYRFVVMAKLVPAGEATKTQAQLTVNPSPAAPDAYRAWWESKLL